MLVSFFTHYLYTVCSACGLQMCSAGCWRQCCARGSGACSAACCSGRIIDALAGPQRTRRSHRLRLSSAVRAVPHRWRASVPPTPTSSPIKARQAAPSDYFEHSSSSSFHSATHSGGVATKANHRHRHAVVAVARLLPRASRGHRRSPSFCRCALLLATRPPAHGSRSSSRSPIRAAQDRDHENRSTSLLLDLAARPDTLGTWPWCNFDAGRGRGARFSRESSTACSAPNAGAVRSSDQIVIHLPTLPPRLALLTILIVGLYLLRGDHRWAHRHVR